MLPHGSNTRWGGTVELFVSGGCGGAVISGSQSLKADVDVVTSPSSWLRSRECTYCRWF
jgi:hypothetical protein